MCLSRVYIEEEDRQERVFEEAAQIIVEDDKVQIYGILGEAEEVKGCHIQKLDFMKHFVVLKRDNQEDEVGN